MNIPDKAVEAAAKAIARAADADYWVDEVSEWEAQDEWEKDHYAEANYPSMAYEDRNDYMAQGRAALDAAALLIEAQALRDAADVMEAQPVVDMTSVAYLRGRADVRDPA